MTPSDKANRQFWATRREEGPKLAAKLSVADFVTEANRQLRADKSYVPDARFVVLPAVTSGGPELPSWEGPVAVRPLIQRIVQEMTRRFELPVPFLIERG